MNRLAWSYLILVFLPAVVLAVFAFRVADQDYDEDRTARRSVLLSAAETLASSVETTVDEAVRRADDALMRAFEDEEWPLPLDTDSVMGFARSGVWLGYRDPRRRLASVPAEDLETYRFSVRGGEYYEFAAKEPELALDAYAFYLPKLRSPELRSRLRFRIARAALAAGGEELGREILRELMNAEDRVASEDDPRLPVSALAAVTLLEHLRSEDTTQEAATVRAVFRDRLLRRHHELPTDVLAFVIACAGVKAPALHRVIRERRTLERTLDRHPELLTGEDAILEGDRIAFARPVPPAGTELLAICWLPVSLPPLITGPDHVVRLDTDLDNDGLGEDGAKNAESEAAEYMVRYPVHIGDEGNIVARVELRDTRMADVLAALQRRRNLQLTLIAFLVALALAGGGALVYYLARERRLARLRTQLLANVSHELKTPATSIRMLSEMLHRDDLGESKSKRFAELLHGESLRLGRIIENVLEFSRIERGKEAFARENVDLRRVVERALESLSYRLREEKIELTREGEHLESDETPIRIFSNENAVECILFNLLDNAIKYTTVKKDRAGADLRPEIRLNVEVDRDASIVRIAVADNGIGISPRDRERIFEEFYRARFEDYGVQGTGLGLSISRALARKLGGDIDLESTPGEGSTFRLTLPDPRREQ